MERHVVSYFRPKILLFFVKFLVLVTKYFPSCEFEFYFILFLLLFYFILFLLRLVAKWLWPLEGTTYSPFEVFL